MMNINRDYLIINDVKKSNIKLDNGSMFFYITDKNTQNIFVNLVINISNNDLIQKYANIENAEDYTLTMNIVKPDNTYKVVEGKLHDKEKAIFEFDLKEDCVDKIGPYRCELLTKCTINGHEEITTSNKITYKVKSSILNDLDNIVEAPEYPLVIQLFDKLSDIEQYEEDRRANELARQLAEEQRQTKHNELVTDMTNSIQVMDNKVVDVENRISAKEQAVDKLVTDTKADIDNYKVAKDQEIDEYKALKDTEINNAITAQDNKIDEAISNQNNRITLVENNDTTQNNRLDTLENKDTLHESRLDAIEAKNQQQDNRLDIVENKNQQQDNRLDVVEAKNVEQDNRLNEIEAIDVAQNTRLDAIEAKNTEQDDRLLDIEKVNKRQDMNLKCLFAESKNNMIDITEEGNNIYLQNSTTGYALIDEIKGNTLVNCNKEPDKELILNGNINTSGNNTVTLTEGVDGGLVDVALEGNTLVNVSKTKDSTAITKAYTVENSGNHIALQGDVDGNCRPVITGNTLWIDTATGEVLTAFDETKNLRLQSTFEDNLVTQEMVDSGEEVADNLGKYRVNYKVTGKNLFDANILEEGSIDGAGVALPMATRCRSSYMRLQSGSYTLTHSTREWCAVLGYDKKYNFVKTFTNEPNTKHDFMVTPDIYFIRVKFDYDIATAKADNIQIEEGATATSYEPYKESTKTLYLNSPLLEGDTIEEKDGGIYHVHRCTKVGLNGSELGWQDNAGEGDTVNGHGIWNVSFNDTIGDSISICDKLPCFNSSGDAAGKTNFIVSYSNIIVVNIAGATTYNDVINWLNTNKPSVIRRLVEPQYELIEQSNLAIPSYTNGHLDFNTAVPVEKVEFLPFSEELTYLYANTQYTVQFNSDKATTADITLGGTKLLAQSIVAGLNRISITTPETLVDNKLTISGVGTNIMEVVVTDTNREFMYFEGMKSVGQDDINGHKVEIVSSNDINGNNYYFETDKIVLPNGTRNILSNNEYTVKIGKIVIDGTQKFSDASIENSVNTYRYSFQIPNMNINTDNNQNSLGDTLDWVFDDSDTVHYKIGMAPDTLFLYIPIEYKDRPNEYFSQNPFTLYYEYTEPINIKLNTQQLTHEPLRAVGDIKDKYVLIDGKWYIERNCGGYTFTGNEKWRTDASSENIQAFIANTVPNIKPSSTNIISNIYPKKKSKWSTKEVGFDTGSNNALMIYVLKSDASTVEELRNYLSKNEVSITYELQTPQYEPIDYNPFEVYSEVTHISNNSTIPCNMTIKNTGYNCLLKPSTTYTISSNLGLNTVTTPSTLTEDCLRFMDTDTSTVTTMNNVMVLEGDYTTGKPLPSHFSGIESAFKQEYDETVGKYKVKAKVVGKNLFDEELELGTISAVTGLNIKYQQELRSKNYTRIPCVPFTISMSPKLGGYIGLRYYDKNYKYLGASDGTKHGSVIGVSPHIPPIGTYYIRFKYISTDLSIRFQIEQGTKSTPYEPYKESVIEFYINEPLRGIGDIKDKVYVKNDKVVVERNCGIRPYEDGDFGTYLTDKIDTVYPLATPTYEEVEYNDTKLFIESFKNSTLFYNSNIPVTSKLWYSYSIPLVDTVAQTANVTDQQDSMIIDLATSVAVMEMMLM